MSRFVCPYCGHLDNRIIDSRDRDRPQRRRRRRECLTCGDRYQTVEMARSELEALILVRVMRLAHDLLGELAEEHVRARLEALRSQL